VISMICSPPGGYCVSSNVRGSIKHGFLFYMWALYRLTRALI
jgi:hypothetical protein